VLESPSSFGTPLIGRAAKTSRRWANVRCLNSDGKVLLSILVNEQYAGPGLLTGNSREIPIRVDPRLAVGAEAFAPRSETTAMHEVDFEIAGSLEVHPEPPGGFAIYRNG
jgi:hypothetical protein